VKVGLKRLQVLLANVEGTSEEALSTSIRAVEDSLGDGLQRFSDDAYLLSSEAELATVLKDSTRAISAMRTAFKSNPRNSVIAVRLAKSLEAGGDTEGARITLQTGLDNNPGDKRLHYAFAKLLMKTHPDAIGQLEYHLQRSFTHGDSNYDAQLLFARQLYIRGDTAAAKERFRALAGAKIGPDIRDRVRYPLETQFSGRIVRLEATYGFVVRDGLGDWVFLHRYNANATLWNRLTVGTRLRFRVGFTMKGPAAIEVALENV
jgi:hypothetical protein